MERLRKLRVSGPRERVRFEGRRSTAQLHRRSGGEPGRRRPPDARCRGGRRSVIVLPEKWTAIGSDEQQRAAAETLEGPAIAWARATARELGVDLVAGSILERVPGREKLANTSVHVDPARRDQGGLSQGAHVRRRDRRARLSGVRARGARRGDRLSRRPPTASSSVCPSATTCASPSSTGSSPCGARA